MRIKLPSWATAALSLGLGVLTYFNQQGTFGIDEPWHTLVTVGLAALAALGVAPLASGKLDTVLHLSYPKALAVSSGLATGAVGLATVAMNVSLRSVLVGMLTVLAGALVGPAPTAAPAKPVAKPPEPAPAPLPDPSAPDPAPTSPAAPATPTAPAVRRSRAKPKP